MEKMSLKMNFQAIPILEEESLSENLQTENMPSLLIYYGQK